MGKIIIGDRNIDFFLLLPEMAWKTYENKKFANTHFLKTMPHYTLIYLEKFKCFLNEMRFYLL